MASIWKGSINFGLVNVPVELRAAVRADHVSFKMLHAEDHSPVRYQRISSATGEEVPWGEIVKGYEYSKGKFIVLTDEDFKSAALESSKTIDICDFVAEDQIDPRYFETPYFVVPTKGGEKAYALLREAMRETASVGIGKIIMRQHQHLTGLHVVGDALVLELMRFANEVVDTAELTFPDASSVRAAEQKMAVQLVRSLEAPFEPEKYTDDYRANLMRLINARAKGEKVELEAPAARSDDGKVLDLMSRLQASLEREKGGRGGGNGGGGGSGKRGGAKTSAAKSAAATRAGRTTPARAGAEERATSAKGRTVKRASAGSTARGATKKTAAKRARQARSA